MWFVYNILFGIGFTALLPYFLWRMARRGGYRRHFMQRLARYDADIARQLDDAADPVWIHAVSVGEWTVASTLMQRLRQRNPGLRFVVTVNTSTAHAMALKTIRAPDVLLYFPVDAPPVVRTVLRRIHPRLFVLVECELWPNLIRALDRRGCPTLVVNGRMSDRSYRGYRRVGVFTRRLLPLLRQIGAQSDEDARRYIALGARPDGVRVTGSMKYDVAARQPDAEGQAAGILSSAGWQPGSRIILAGGSTWAGEETILLDLYRELRPAFPALRLFLAPRHVERLPEILPEIEKRGLTLVRRSLSASASAAPSDPDVFLLDTTGELKHFYAAADIIFVGKSLTQHGGQNPIEPAAAGRAVLCGPNMENFRRILEDFRQADAVRVVQDAAGLKSAVSALLSDDAARRELGRRAGDLVARQSGAADRTVDLIADVLTPVPPSARPAPDEPFELVDETGRVTGLSTRRACHGNPALMHQSVHVIVRDAAGRWFLQKRSARKDTQPGRWDTSVGGHMQPGEKPDEAARREMHEELGVSPPIEFLYQYIWRSDRETELVRTYAASCDGPFRLDPGEIDEGRFWAVDEIRRALGTGVFTPNFELEFDKFFVSPPGRV